jgi:hypothetical protein
MRKQLARVAAAVIAFAVVVPGAAGAAGPIRVSASVQATKFDLVPTRQYGSPDVAVDPENALNVVATLPNLQTKNCGLMRSTDGGVTWSRLNTDRRCRRTHSVSSRETPM